jgi:hypothetical protein
MKAAQQHLEPKIDPGASAKAIGIDRRSNTVQRALVMGEDLGKRWDVGHVGSPRLSEGGMHAPFFASVACHVFFRRGSGAQDAGSAGCDAIGAG